MMRTVGIYVFDEIEVLDLGGPFEVFSVAARVKARLEPGSPPPFQVFTVGRTPAPVTARGGLRVLPAYAFVDHPPIDLLVIPGGVVTAELKEPTVISWITQAATRAEVIAGVCTGSFLLAEAGLLDGKRATTHWEDLADLRAAYPRVLVEENTRWIQDGELFTSAGITAGIDLALELVARLESPTLAQATARQMDYAWGNWSKDTPGT